MTILSQDVKRHNWCLKLMLETKQWCPLEITFADKPETFYVFSIWIPTLQLSHHIRQQFISNIYLNSNDSSSVAPWHCGASMTTIVIRIILYQGLLTALARMNLIKLELRPRCRHSNDSKQETLSNTCTMHIQCRPGVRIGIHWIFFRYFRFSIKNNLP